MTALPPLKGLETSQRTPSPGPVASGGSSAPGQILLVLCPLAPRSGGEPGRQGVGLVAFCSCKANFRKETGQADCGSRHLSLLSKGDLGLPEPLEVWWEVHEEAHAQKYEVR